MEQRILTDYSEIETYIKEKNSRTILLVCGKSIDKLRIGEYFTGLSSNGEVKIVRFSGFKPNPDYSSVVDGVKYFTDNACDMIIAVGGGSAMDVAKCIKLFALMDTSKNYLEQKIVPNDIPLMVVPTTAGTGSEATRFSVIYLNGVKQSVNDISSIPEAVLFDPSALMSLPEYHKVSSMMDALCHSVESSWSVNSTDESREYASNAIRLIMEHYRNYLAGDDAASVQMLKAANLAGKAINITQTTAGHAMCYKLTSMYGLAHGHSAALCVSVLFPFMLDNPDKCIDPRGEDHLAQVFDRLSDNFGCGDPRECAERFTALLNELKLQKPDIGPDDIMTLADSVNAERLKNHPIKLTRDDIVGLYESIRIGR